MPHARKREWSSRQGNGSDTAREGERTGVASVRWRGCQMLKKQRGGAATGVCRDSAPCEESASRCSRIKNQDERSAASGELIHEVEVVKEVDRSIGVAKGTETPDSCDAHRCTGRIGGWLQISGDSKKATSTPLESCIIGLHGYWPRDRIPEPAAGGAWVNGGGGSVEQDPAGFQQPLLNAATKSR